MEEPIKSSESPPNPSIGKLTVVPGGLQGLKGTLNLDSEEKEKLLVGQAKKDSLKYWNEEEGKWIVKGEQKKDTEIELSPELETYLKSKTESELKKIEENLDKLADALHDDKEQKIKMTLENNSPTPNAKRREHSIGSVAGFEKVPQADGTIKYVPIKGQRFDKRLNETQKIHRQPEKKQIVINTKNTMVPEKKPLTPKTPTPKKVTNESDITAAYEAGSGNRDAWEGLKNMKEGIKEFKQGGFEKKKQALIDVLGWPENVVSYYGEHNPEKIHRINTANQKFTMADLEEFENLQKKEVGEFTFLNEVPNWQEKRVVVGEKENSTVFSLSDTKGGVDRFEIPNTQKEKIEKLKKKLGSVETTLEDNEKEKKSFKKMKLEITSDEFGEFILSGKIPQTVLESIAQKIYNAEKTTDGKNVANSDVLSTAEKQIYDNSEQKDVIEELKKQITETSREAGQRKIDTLGEEFKTLQKQKEALLEERKTLSIESEDETVLENTEKEEIEESPAPTRVLGEPEEISKPIELSIPEETPKEELARLKNFLSSGLPIDTELRNKHTNRIQELYGQIIEIPKSGFVKSSKGKEYKITGHSTNGNIKYEYTENKKTIKKTWTKEKFIELVEKGELLLEKK